MTRFVVRPASISRTPRELAHLLNAQTRRYPSNTNIRFNYQSDLFLIYPPPSHVETQGRSEHGQFTAPLSYAALHRFYSSNKFTQRSLLSQAHVPTLDSYSTRHGAAQANPGQFVVRSLRHSGGRDYRIAQEATDFVEGREYIARVYPKTAEYRLIYVLGTPLILLKKKNPNNIPPELPWNYNNGSSFSTIKDIPSSKIARSGLIEKLTAVPIIIHAHLAAVDILWSDDRPPAVCEVNTCPGLSIEANLEKVAAHVHTARGSQRSVEPPALPAD
jgi:hypothetical protein